MRSTDRGFDAVVIGEPQLGVALDAYTAGSAYTNHAEHDTVAPGKRLRRA